MNPKSIGGSGGEYGNSDGNMIARQALVEDQPSDLVCVRREDAKLLDHYLDGQVKAGRVGSRTGSAHNHLKDALNDCK